VATLYNRCKVGAAYTPDMKAQTLTLHEGDKTALEYLGAAVVLQWSNLPEDLRKSFLQQAGSVGGLPFVANLHGQIEALIERVRGRGPGVGRVLVAPGSRYRSRRRADAIAQGRYANGLGAMLAAEEGAVLLEPVADDPDAAVLAGRRQRMDRAFEAVEGVGGTVHADLKCLVVVVSAGFASGHDNPRNGCVFGGLRS